MLCGVGDEGDHPSSSGAAELEEPFGGQLQRLGIGELLIMWRSARACSAISRRVLGYSTLKTS